MEMNKILREILFKAELERHIVSECEDQARILCGENPDKRLHVIEQLRDLILERGECYPPRLDDAFLLRFLRARNCIPARAHRLLARYCKFREQNPHLWRDVYWYGLARLGNIFEGVLFDRPDVGRLIIGRLGQWDPDVFSADELVRGCLLLLEFAFPLQQRSVHIVNCSRVIENLFYLFKRLAPADDLWKRVYFHGYDYSSLHRYLDQECLPERYGGHREAVSLGEWLTAINQYRKEDFDKDMSSIGYAV
ncbi:clavesin-1-like isoform X2 [Pieris napi]|uniref:clavesin-1-like isoform X2 n=1 Tax=Pieris napi TaxID=78633 RepID=UPI001FB8AF57|nr:clavesin-1-like isoform X2 [Pieris napi]